MKKPRRDLRKWLKKNRISITLLAEILGLGSPSTVWEWINNDRVPRKETLDKFNRLIKKESRGKSFPAKEFFVFKKKKTKRLKK